MSPRSTLAIVLTSLSLMTIASAAYNTDAEFPTDLPAVPATPAAPAKVIEAQLFTLEVPYATEWRMEQPLVRAGIVLVLEVDPHLVWPRALPQPILYIGNAVAERLHNGHVEGRIVVVAPLETDAQGRPLFDPATTPIWFGTPGLPEEVDAARIERERRQAEAAGFGLGTAETLQAALSGVGAQRTANLTNRSALLSIVGALIEKHAPSEAEFGRSLRGILPPDPGVTPN